MYDWIFWAGEQVEEIAKNDPPFQELYRKHEAIVDEFEDMLQELSQYQRELILEYITISGDMDNRRSQIAFMLGKKTGDR